MNRTTLTHALSSRARNLIVLLVAVVLPLMVLGQSQTTSAPEYPDEIRGYKVEKKARLTGGNAAETGESIDLTGLIELGTVRLGPLSLEQLNLEIPITVRAIKQKGEIHFMVFDQMTLNGVRFAVSEYNTPFKIPNESPVTLPRNLELHLSYEGVAKTALAGLIEPDTPLRIEGNVLVFGKFKRFFFSAKRVVPVSFSFEQPNPLADYSPLKRIIGQSPTAPLLGRSPATLVAFEQSAERTRVSRPWYLKIEDDQEIRMSSGWAAEAERKYGVLEDPQVHQYLSEVGQRLARASQRPDLKYTFRIINSYDVQPTAAFTFGGGQVFVLRSFLDDVESEAELAFVLAHEIGHNAGYHIPLQIQRRMILDKAINEITLLSGKISSTDLKKAVDEYTNKASAFVLLQFSRSDEKEADVLGVGNMFDAGYDPRVTLQWAKKGLRSIKEWIEGLSNTHPSPEERYEYLSDEIQKLGTKPDLIVNTDAFKAMKERLKSIPKNTGVSKN